MNNILLQRFFSVFAFLLFQSAFAQLTDFTLQVTPTDETCTGNGTLTFTVANTTAGANMVYAIYLLPNTATPIASISQTTIGGLTAGNYRIVATQTLGNESNFEQQDVTITTTIESLTYQLSGSVICNDGVLTVNVFTGNPVQYEILSGPVTRPLQTSNVFTLLPAGVYVVRVVDACGDALVQTYTLLNPADHFEIASVHAPNCPLIDCNTTEIATQFNAEAGSVISYPLLVEYVIHPPTGPAISITQTVTEGSPSAQQILNALPFYDQTYTIDVRITDACGNVTYKPGNIIDEDLEIILQSASEICARNIKIEACNYVPPFTVSFISAPPGFNPALFNGGHPGPYAEIPIIYVSNDINQIPIGNYTVQITDGCGRTAQDTIEIEATQEPLYTMLPQGCGTGQVSSPGQNGSPVATVIITSAPAAYNHTLPHDVSFNITEGHFLMDELPAGTYVFTIISLCGDSYEYTITIPASTQQPVLISYIKGCAIGYGSIKMGVQSTKLAVARIVSAPAAFPQTLPYDISFNIYEIDGNLYMNGLPQGIYSIYLKDECGVERTITIDIPGYQELVNVVDVEANCGSFNLQLDYTSNETATHSYWLQRLNPITGGWEHPFTGALYLEGSEPNPQSSFLLLNHSMNLNFATIGTFRVVKSHKLFGNGTTVLAVCVVPIKEFIFTGGPQIVDAFALPCATNPGQVTIVAQGIAPLHYYITSKDGNAFYVDNNTSPNFSGLTPGIYNFQVRDVCQNIVNRLFDLGSIPPPHIAQSVLCEGQNGQLSVEGFDFLNYQWWNGANPNNILSTTNVLNFTPFTSATVTGTYFVRIFSSTPGLCTDQTVSYTIPASGSNPQAGEGLTLDICGSSGTIDLFTLLSGTHSMTGNWQELTNSGMQIGHSWLPVGIPYGTYQFKYTVDGLCGTSDEADVTIHFNPIPPIPVAAATPLVCSTQPIAFTATDIPGATYAWSGPNGFTASERNPVIANATAEASGTYTVMATIGTCVSPAASVTVAVAPTPDFNLVAGCNGNAYTIKAEAVSGFEPSVTFAWSGPNNFTKTENPVTITEKGNYSLTVTTENGCTFTKAIEVATTACAISSGISPNGDGDNEFLDLTGFDVLKFKIFSRYGNIVFEQDDYTNQWHGQDKNGHQLPDATYYYYIKLKTGEERTGWVYVTK